MLKYLFEVQFKDGTIYKQTPKDISLLEPEKRSAYYDIAQAINEVKTFKLVKESVLNKQTWLVDLEDGHFEHNGQKIMMGWSSLEDNPPKALVPPLELVYYRQVQQHVNFNQDGSDPTHIGSDVVYYMGWKDSTGTIRTIGIE